MGATRVSVKFCADKPIRVFYSYEELSAMLGDAVSKGVLLQNKFCKKKNAFASSRKDRL